MVSSGTVSGDLSNFTTALSSYSSSIEGLSSSWKGPSFDSITGKAEEFCSSFNSTISSQMQSFAEACSLYEAYENAKSNYDTSVDNYNKAVNNNDSANASTFQSDMNKYEAEMKAKKQEILDKLSSASSTTLEATSVDTSTVGSASTAGSASSSKTGDATSAVANNPNLFASKDSGYVFPFEKGVDAPVTSSVGYRDAPTAGASSNHKGTDIGVPVGTEIHSLSSGTVLHAGPADGYGQWVQIQQDDGKIVTYGHISKYDYFSEGDRVNAGDLIALSGNEGVSTGPHLHLQIEDADGNIYSAEDYFQDCWPT